MVMSTIILHQFQFAFTAKDTSLELILRKEIVDDEIDFWPVASYLIRANVTFIEEVRRDPRKLEPQAAVLLRSFAQTICGILVDRTNEGIIQVNIPYRPGEKRPYNAITQLIFQSELEFVDKTYFVEGLTLDKYAAFVKKMKIVELT